MAAEFPVITLPDSDHTAPKVKIRSDQGTNFANCLRGIAILAVVASHYLGVFWEKPLDVAAFINADPPLGGDRAVAGGLTDTVHFITSYFGAFGVALFFLISGFVIPFSLQNYSAKGFLVGRLLRIYPTYCAGFAISIATIALVGYYSGKPFPYTWREVLVHIPGLRDILWSRSIDGIIWTLEVEVRFYLLCALLSPWLRACYLRVFLVPVAIGGLILLAVNPWMASWADSNLEFYKLGATVSLIGQNIVFMFVGVVWFYLHYKRIGWRWGAALIALLLLLFAAMWRTSIYTPSFYQICSYVTACIVFTVGAKLLNGDGFIARVLSSIAQISYPMYVIHGVLGYALLTALVPAVSGLAAVTTTCIFVSVVSAVLHKFIEEPTRHLGQNYARSLSGQTSPKQTILTKRPCDSSRSETLQELNHGG